MSDQAAILLFLSPFALLWVAAFTFEAVRAVAVIRREDRQ